MFVVFDDVVGSVFVGVDVVVDVDDDIFVVFEGIVVEVAAYFVVFCVVVVAIDVEKFVVVDDVDDVVDTFVDYVAVVVDFVAAVCDFFVGAVGDFVFVETRSYNLFFVCDAILHHQAACPAGVSFCADSRLSCGKNTS